MVSLPSLRKRSPGGSLARRGPRARTLYATDGRDILANDPQSWEILQPWLWFTGPAGSDGTGGPWGNPPPGAMDYPGYVSLPAVGRCTSLLTETIAGMPWFVFRGWEKLDTPPWISDPQVLREDGRVQASTMDQARLSAVEFWTQWLVSALWYGDGYIWCPVRNVDGSPATPMWIINPQTVTIDDGQYYVGDVLMNPGEIIHLRGNPPYVKGHGTGVFDRNGLDIALAATVRQYAGSQYQSGIPYGYIKSTQPRMDAKQATDLKTGWMAQHGNAQRNIAVLNATTDFVPLGISPIDAQLGQAREWSLRDVAMAFGVPTYMLGVPGDSATYANVESRMIEFRTFSLLPIMRRVESTLDAQFPKGTELKIISAGLERADTMTRYNAYKLAIDSGIMTRDEARALENLPPLGTSADESLPANHPGPPAGDANSEPPPINDTLSTQETL